MKKVTVLIPCHNEAAGIADVIKGFPRAQMRKYGFELDVLVIDNNSTDNTTEVALAVGARVIHETKKGKGNAIRAGFYHLSDDTEFVVMLDGDNTYRSSEILRLLEPLNSGFSNVVIGSRMHGRINEGSMKRLNHLGNRIYSRMVRTAFRVPVTDVLTGYFAWTRGAVERLRPHLTSEGFAIEMEMITKMARLGEEIFSVPISYEARAGESNLRPFYDGSRILMMFFRGFRWNPPITRHYQMAFVYDAVYPFHKGGKEKRLYEITKRLVREDREIHIYTMKWWDGPNSIIHEGVHLHALTPRLPLYNGRRRSMKQAILFGLATFKLLFARFDLLDVDHMPFFPIFAARLVCWIRRKPLFGTWNEVWGPAYWQVYLGGINGKIAAFIEQLSFRLPDTFITISAHTTRKLRENGVKKPIKTVPLGVDLQGIYAVKPADHSSDIMYAGRLLAHKNVDLLIKAVSTVVETYPDVKVKIVGEGPERERLERLTHRLRLTQHIEFISFVEDHQDLYGMMKSSRVFVLPSTREGFGLVVVEANAAGLPVITTSHPDNAARDLIREGQNGLLAKPTKADIAAKILQLLEESEDYTPQGALDQYDWNVVTDNLEEAMRI